jgi:hypothetical protein
MMKRMMTLGIPCAALLLTLSQLPAAASASFLPSARVASKAVSVAQRGNRFNRCMQRCFQQGYNTRICPEKCGAQ